MKMKRYLRSLVDSRDGMAIVYVIIIVAVVVIVSVALYQTSNQDGMQVERDNSGAQAYYYAKSGVEIAVGYILKDATYDPGIPGDTFYGNIGNSSFSSSIPYDDAGNEAYNVKFTITSQPDDTNKDKDIKYLIESTGYAGNIGSEGGTQGSRVSANALGFSITRTALDKSVEGGDSDVITGDVPAILGLDYTSNYAVFTNKGIDIDNGSPMLNGNVGTNYGPVKMNYSSQIYTVDGKDGTMYLGPGAAVSYPQWRTINWKEIKFKPEMIMPKVPALPAAGQIPQASDIPNGANVEYSPNITSTKTVNLASGSVTKFKSVTLEWNDVLTFSLKDDATVIIEKLNSSGEIKVTGKGRLLLIIKSDINGSRTLINQNGDSSKLTIYATGSSIELKSGGSGSSISGTIFAPNAIFKTSHPTNITGDLILGGNTISFEGVSHKGGLYALSNDAIVNYSGNRSWVDGTVTNIYSAGNKVTVSAAHLKGDIYLSNTSAKVELSSSTTFNGNIFTNGNNVLVSGSAVIKGHIIAPSKSVSISFKGGSGHEGAIISGGSLVDFSGGSIVFSGLIIAPYADFRLTGGAKINGSITSGTFYADGGSAVVFKDFNYGDLPVIIDPTETESSSKSDWRVYGEWIKG